MKKETKLEKKARIAYTHYTDNNPVVHCNRFTPWAELSDKERKYWMDTERLAHKGYKHFVDLMPPEKRKESKYWDQLPEYERHIWRMTEQKARQCYEKEAASANESPWVELSDSQRHQYRLKAMGVEHA